MQVLSQFHDLILCIISALEARDPYTSHHSSRVAEMTETICELIGLDEEEKLKSREDEILQFVDCILQRRVV